MSLAIKLENLDPEFFQIAKEVKKDGSYFDHKIVEAKDQTSMKWFIVALVVGSVVVIGVGGFGAVGLLQSHGLITLPQSFHWLASAIGTIGNTPHFWSLYVVTGGGLLIGGGLITFGSIKVHKARKLRRQLIDPIKVTRDDYYAKRDAIKKSFNVQNFAAMKLRAEDYGDHLPDIKTYSTRHFGQFVGQDNDRKFVPESREDRNFIMVRMSDGTLQCTGRLTQPQQDNILAYLKIQGFTEAQPKKKD